MCCGDLGSAPGLLFYLRILWQDAEALLGKTEVGLWLDLICLLYLFKREGPYNP